MKFASEASKLLTNKYFLYFIVFLAASNVLGYLVTNKVNAVIFFALVAFLMTNFSKNMTVILLVAIIATNLLMANRTMREGLENATETDNQMPKKPNINTDDETDTDKLSSVDGQMGKGLKVLKESKDSDEANSKLKDKMQDKQNSSSVEEEAFGDMEDKPIIDPNNRGLNKRKTEGSNYKPLVVAEDKKKNGFHNKKGTSSLSNAAPVNGGSRIDYATTLEDAYTNLDNILGSDGIDKLTNDTQRLMNQQQKLFDTMTNMLPMIDKAKGMMDSIDMGQLGGLTEMANSLKNK